MSMMTPQMKQKWMQTLQLAAMGFLMWGNGHLTYNYKQKMHFGLIIMPDGWCFAGAWIFIYCVMFCSLFAPTNPISTDKYVGSLFLFAQLLNILWLFFVVADARVLQWLDMMLLTGDLILIYVLCGKKCNWSPIPSSEPKSTLPTIQFLMKYVSPFIVKAFLGLYIGWVIQLCGLTTIVCFRAGELALNHIFCWLMFIVQMAFSLYTMNFMNLVSSLWYHICTMPYLNAAILAEFIVVSSITFVVMAAIAIWDAIVLHREHAEETLLHK